jgi:ribosomal protein L20A (L18A)
MPKFIVEASEEVFYYKEVEAKNEKEAIEIFNKTLTNDDMVDGQGFTIEQVSEVKNV